MIISKKRNGTTLEIALKGRLDAVTAPELQDDLSRSLENVTELVFDFSKLEYMSSAGIRVLLYANKMLNHQGAMKIVHTNALVREVFEMTGMERIISFE